MEVQYLDRYRVLGLNVAFYRKRLGYTQESLAEALGVSWVHIGKIECAAVGTSLDMLFRIADTLQVEPSKLLEMR